ncbi:hypothetical protein DENSPDRAFT_679185 [Dentipellis sp. KUC8613]|nr:hypothetical protein DENSPDRAFT_679185 [Dentipellis sp. KUC8613]
MEAHSSSHLAAAHGMWLNHNNDATRDKRNTRPTRPRICDAMRKAYIKIAPHAHQHSTSAVERARRDVPRLA